MKSFLGKLYLILILCETAGAINGIAAWGHADDKEGLFTGNPVFFCSTGLVALLTIYFVSSRVTEIWRMFLRLRWIFLLYSWVILTIFWSDYQALSAISVLRLCLYLLSAGYVSLRYSMDEVLHLFSLALIATALLSVPGQFILPHLDLMDGAGWQGIFGHKNSLGLAMQVEVIILVWQRKRWTLRRICALGLCATVLALSRSDTAIVSALLTLMFIAYQRWPGRGRAAALIVVAGLTSILLFVSNPISLLLSAGGRDSSLTGRDAVWAFAAVGIAKRPILGYGYQAFWSDSDWTLQALHWSPPHAHNGLLQAWLDLGAVGVILMIGLLVNTWRRARRVSKYDSSQTACWTLTLLAMAMFHNLTESDFVSIKLIWYMILFSSFSLFQLERRANSAEVFVKQEGAEQTISLSA